MTSAKKAVNQIIFLLITGLFFCMPTLKANGIPQHTDYYRIYNLLDELANEGVIELNSAMRPYSRAFIAKTLDKAINSPYFQQKSKQTSILLAELLFYANAYALEYDRLPESSRRAELWRREPNTVASVWAPGFFYRDSIFRASITPILGMHLIHNNNGTIDKRWFGADFQGTIGKYFSIYGSLRDISHMGDGLLSGANYLNAEPGYEYTVGSDYSDSRGGIVLGNQYLSISLKKDHIIWGDHLHQSNILSGRTPSFPMLSLQLKPVEWFELNYFHGWLVSNEFDSTYYYLENGRDIHYRPAPKYMAANLFTFRPIPQLFLSVGNAIVYAERNIQPSYLIPIAFYKSMDHTLTKGLGTENQNSQLFFNFSSRNIKHLHLFTSVFIDEIQFRRFLPDSPDRNPISWKIGAQLSNFPLTGFTLMSEYTRSNILNYKHSIPTLTWASNNYNLGHYMGDNADELFVAMRYRPIRGLDLQLTYLNARKGNDYDYVRRGTYEEQRQTVINIISNPSLGEIIWKNETVELKATYELFNNGYALFKIAHTDIQGFEASKPAVFGENRYTAQQALNQFSPAMLHGRQLTATLGFSIGF